MLFKLVLTLALTAPDHGQKLRAALQLEEQGNSAAAGKELERLVANSPSWDLARIEAGRFWLGQGEGLDRAQFHLDAALSLAPENPRAHYLWGLLMNERRRTDEAVRAFETALLIRDDYDDARFRLAGLYHSAGKYEDAARCWRRYLSRHPGEVGPQLQLAAALEGMGHPRDAESELKKLFADQKTRELGGRKLAEFYDRQGRAAEAARVRRDSQPKGRKLRDLLPSKR
jgi:tetratricopeptide (TPR) repeat protein